MTRILIYGEGPHDVGRREWSPRTRAREATEGWLQPMVRRLRHSAGIEEGRRLQELVRLPRKGAPSPLDGLALKAQIAKFRAGLDGFDAVILATDADSADRAKYDSKVEAIVAGFEAMPGAVVGVACVPMGTSEAWLLADAGAWAELGATDLGERPRRVERSWGYPDDPDSNHPKSVFARICAANDIADNTDTRARLAETCERAMLEQSCPVSFSPFATQVSAI